MELAINEKPTKLKPASKLGVTLRVSRETKRKLAQELQKANKKAFGRRVKADAILVKALSLLSDKDILELQEASLSNADRLERAYQDFQKQHGALSKDEYIGKLMSGDVEKVSSSGKVLQASNV